MMNEKVSRRYATAIFSLAKDAKTVDAVHAGLRAAQSAISRDAEVARFFISPVIDRVEKAAVLRRALEGKVDVIVLHAVLLLVRKRREALLHAIVTEFDKLALADVGREPLEITSARGLGPQELEQMVTRLSRAYGRQFTVTQRVDPSVLGGVRIAMNDRRIDGSVSGRLDQLARELFSRT